MSTIVMTEQEATPATPTAGRVRIYFTTTGNLCSVDDTGAVTVYAAGVTPEQVQDIVGGILVDTASIDLVYDDALDQIRANVIPSGVDHDALQNFVANEHIDHNAVSISAGTGLTGGGDITASRTLSLANTAVTAGSYGSSSQVSAFTVDAQGRLTAASNITITPAAIGAQPLDSDLTAVAGLAGTGIIVRTGTGTATTRTITAGTGITLANGDGVAGNPTVTLGNTSVTAASYGSSSQVGTFTVDAQGRLTAAANTTIDHTLINNRGTNTHAQIDSHIASTANPHNVTAAQVGNATAQWNANQLQSRALSATAPTAGQTITWNAALSQWEPQTPAGSVTSNNAESGAVASTTTTSTSYVNLDSCELTDLPAGTYLVTFSVSSLNSGNGAQRNFFVLAVDTTAVPNSERVMGVSGGAYNVVSAMTLVTITSGQTIRARWRVAAGTGTCLGRNITAVRVS